MIIWSGAYGLGDVLLMTAPCKFRNDITVLLHESVSRFAFLFDGIATIEYIKDIPATGCGKGTGTYAQRLMKYCNLDNMNCLPYIKLKYQDKAKYLLDNINNPVIFKPNCSVQWSKLREPKDYNYWNSVCYNPNVNYIYIGSKPSVYTFIKKSYIDLDLPTLASLYSIVGKYVGVDTGDMHLMLSVGGNCEVHVPSTTDQYNHNDWHYNYDQCKYFVF